MAELLGMHTFNENGAESTLRRMRILCTDMDTMLQCKLLSMAPPSARIAVASRDFPTAEDLAHALDEAIERESLTITMSQSSISSPSEPAQQHDIAAAAKRTSHKMPQGNTKHGNDLDICFYHERFGYKARKCSGAPCKFAGLKLENAQASH